ncbi:MAG: hypothetical protein ACKVOH_00530 [Chlamydiales bacterium]
MAAAYQTVTYANIGEQLAEQVQYKTDFQPANGQASECQAQYVSYLTKLSKLLRGRSFFALAPTTPMAVRQVIVAHDRARATRVHGGDVDEKSVRIKNIMAATFGFGLTATARAIRVAFRVITSPVSLLVSAWQASKYDKEKGYRFWEGRVGTDLTRMGYECVDCLTTLIMPFIGIINTIAPEAISTDRLRDYYVARMDAIGAKDAEFQTNENKFWAEHKQKMVAAKRAAEQAQGELDASQAARLQSVRA